ncbi:MAG: tRNA (adenosine(37)-N6)-threonylcarbamoyltransferase complex ATPase subunit type 1 TsaE [Dehalococcoidia bacterium]|nr:tRNA (adenosine(37)-N6)-threonylcarbamoyltransferase complex ATPase subunit type 1 TsaE [Dehalococcoidia bacterium]
MKLLTHSPEETQALGEALGKAAQPGDLFLLWGELGAGKTCLVQGIARGLGVRDTVRSPTFVIVTHHPGRLTLYHIDLYRLDNPLEVLDLGLDEYIEGGGVCVVEWADKAMPLFPLEHLVVELRHVGEQERQIMLTAFGARYVELVAQVRQQMGLE